MSKVKPRWLLVCVLFACMTSAKGVAQESKSDQKKPNEPTVVGDPKESKERIHVIPFWESDHGDQIRAAVTMIGAGSPFGALSVRVAVSESVRTIAGWPFVFETVLPLNRRYLELVKDGNPWPDMTRRDPRELKGADLAIYLALNQAIQRSDRASASMFERSAAEFKDATYVDLNKLPNKLRGKVITVTGKMPVLRRVEAPRLIRDEVSHCYTGWIIGPTKGAPSFCVLFTELPKDVEVSEEFDRMVTFQGYFLAHVRFPADKHDRMNQKDIVAPYLVGKTLTVHAKAAEAPQVPEALNHHLMWYLVGGVVGVFVLLVIVNIWLRRGDRRIEAQVARMRDKHQPFNLEPDDAPPARVEPDSTEFKRDFPPP